VGLWKPKVSLPFVSFRIIFAQDSTSFFHSADPKYITGWNDV